MQIRLAPHTERLGDVVAFHRGGIGLPEIGGYRGHNGSSSGCASPHTITSRSCSSTRASTRRAATSDVEALHHGRILVLVQSAGASDGVAAVIDG